MAKVTRIFGTDYDIAAVLRMSKGDFLKQHKHCFDAEKAYDQIHREHGNASKKQVTETHSKTTQENAGVDKGSGTGEKP